VGSAGDEEEHIMADEPSSQSSARTIVITSVISAIATIMVSFIAIVPQLRKGDRDDITRLGTRVDQLTKQVDTANSPPPGDRWTITGVVTKGDSAPVSSAEVYLLPATGSENITATDDKGGFVFENMPLRAYWIVTRDNASGSSSRVLMGGDNKDGEIRLTGNVIKYHFSKE
jgi:hypothetical protein